MRRYAEEYDRVRGGWLRSPAMEGYDRGLRGGWGMRSGYGGYRGYDLEGGYGVNGQTVPTRSRGRTAPPRRGVPMRGYDRRF